MQGVPAGFRFTPTDEELIEFLQKILRGESLANVIVFEDIYGDKEPWLIFDKTLKKKYYVFTKLKKKSKSRMERMVGCGTWKEDGSDPILNHEKICIGSKKSFHFYVKPSSSSSTKETTGHWIMHEYSIGKLDDYVVCEIRNKDLDNLKGGYEPQLWAAWEQIVATDDVSQRLNTRDLESEKENQQQKKTKFSNHIAAQQPMDTGLVLTSSIAQPQEAPYMHNEFVLIHDVATDQGYDVQSFDTAHLSMEDGYQQQYMIQCGGNNVATDQFNELCLLDSPIESSWVDSIFDGLPDIDPTITNIEDIHMGDYVDYSRLELNFDSQNTFDVMTAQPPMP